MSVRAAQYLMISASVLALGGIIFRLSVKKKFSTDRNVEPSTSSDVQIYNSNVEVIESPESLVELMDRYGIARPNQPSNTKVILDVFDEKAPTQKKRYFLVSSSKDSSRGDWIPASTTKTFAALGALKRLSDLGYGPDAQIVFRDAGGVATSAKELVNRAIIPSDNMAYNRLVQLAGHRSLNDDFLSARYPNTEINKPYFVEEWRKLTGGNTTFASPEIVVDGVVRVPAAFNRLSRMCGAQQACTTLVDLNNLLFDILCKVPEGVSQENLEVLRAALGARKATGQEFSDEILRYATQYDFSVFGKHGFNGSSYAQSALLYDRGRQKVYIVSATGAPGKRDVLNDVGRALGQLLNAHSF